MDVLDFNIVEQGQKIPQRESWNIIPVQHITAPKDKMTAHRLNSFGSLFYLSQIVLKNRRLSTNLHLDIALAIESELLKLVLEIPRDHFKTTIASESAPIWWALPFNDNDANLMLKLGYSDEFIKWMKKVHDRNTRTLLISETNTNAVKIGSRIAGHYENNALFRHLFKEVMPDSKCIWKTDSMSHKRDANKKHDGEGTFDFLGVGNALQSRHYDRVVQDDLFGREALKSQLAADTTIEYHKLLVGAFDSRPGGQDDNDELVIGNRWAYQDLNSWIKDNEPYFTFITHSALGGCCPKHPAGIPIFPEEFSVEKLERWSKRLGPYLFSCQFLNQPISPEASKFDLKFLRYYKFANITGKDNVRRTYIVHEVQDGIVTPPIPVADLRIICVADPNHAGAEGRANNAYVVLGLYISDNPEISDRVYLLEEWADTTEHNLFIDKIYDACKRFKLSQFWLETIGAQTFLKMYLDYKNRVENTPITINPLKTPKSRDAKDDRILGLQPALASSSFFVQRLQTGFIREFGQFPFGKLRDRLDVVGYGLELFGMVTSRSEVLEWIQNYDPPKGLGKCGY